MQAVASAIRNHRIGFHDYAAYARTMSGGVPVQQTDLKTVLSRFRKPYVWLLAVPKSDAGAGASGAGDGVGSSAARSGSGRRARAVSGGEARLERVV